ncbi:hypothetical protein DXT89_00120 [Agrobacterium vitis]|uniref:Phenol degradation protein meta n=1 Tax=Agrobacterium vitis TaxID=373 RepID=A0A368NZP9_AGRVI|nr:hypothetical protein DXM22_03615 [Agrobacterium vitis]KAA3531841.1 hypothetical protein DXT89_00120 [Agrobacterium vitis]RCU54969.1 hypothetical protein ASB66_008265 [Agrobacterium vitis]
MDCDDVAVLVRLGAPASIAITLSRCFMEQDPSIQSRQAAKSTGRGTRPVSGIRRLAAGLFCCLAVAVSAADHAVAAEAGALNWGPGAPGLTFGALPPVPGLFFTNTTAYFSSSEFHGANGKRNSVLDLDQKGVVSVSRIMGVWPVDLNGWRFATQVVIPVVYSDTDFDNIPVQGHAGGLGNMSVVQLTNYNFARFHNVGASVSFTGRTSNYDSSRSINTQNGYSTVSAGAHYNYFDPTGLDFGVMAGYHYNNRNPTTDYRSGDLFALDFKLTYALNDKIRIGAYGGYLAQIEDDKAGSVSLADSRFKAINLGPSITYAMGPVDATLSYQFSVHAENATKSDAVRLSFNVPLYVPKPGP